MYIHQSIPFLFNCKHCCSWLIRTVSAGLARDVVERDLLSPGEVGQQEDDQGGSHRRQKSGLHPNQARCSSTLSLSAIRDNAEHVEAEQS